MSENAGHVQFKDFDDSRVFAKFESSILSAESLNFVLEFDSAKALGALDLDQDGFKALLTAEVRYESKLFLVLLLTSCHIASELIYN